MASKAAQSPDSAQNGRSDPNLAGSQPTLAVTRQLVDRRTGEICAVGDEGSCNSLYPGSTIPVQE